MPARDIKLGDMTLHVHGQHMSEYETQLNGYTTEKPKLYNLILSEDYYKGAVVCLYKPIQSYELYTISSINDDDLKHNKKYQFTQEEIDEYNKSFWIKNLDLNDYKVEVRTDEE